MLLNPEVACLQEFKLSNEYENGAIPEQDMSVFDPPRRLREDGTVANIQS